MKRVLKWFGIVMAAVVVAVMVSLLVGLLVSRAAPAQVGDYQEFVVRVDVGGIRVNHVVGGQVYDGSSWRIVKGLVEAEARLLSEHGTCDGYYWHRWFSGHDERWRILPYDMQAENLDNPSVYAAVVERAVQCSK